MFTGDHGEDEMKDRLKTECSCPECQSFCSERVGWFIPDEVKGLLEYFESHDVDALLNFGNFAIDWWCGDDQNILILAPNIVGNGSIQFPFNPKGECIFYKEGRCAIHPVKPFECSRTDHNMTHEEADEQHKWIAEQWENSDILSFYNDKVDTESYGLNDLLFFDFFK
jgi:Fe-S-cluster containining protein